MRKLVFRENNSKHDKPVIEAGNWWEKSNGERVFNSVLDIMPKEEFVLTDCGDAYMDYSISFDTILAVADKIKELRKRKKNENKK